MKKRWNEHGRCQAVWGSKMRMRPNYLDWVRELRALWSDRTFVIRPQTYRLSFKKVIGMMEPQFFASTCSSQEVKEK
jgi:hypothetical protein